MRAAAASPRFSQHHFGCSTARNEGTCSNLLTIRRDAVEATVLDALRHRLMDLGLYAVFVAEFTAEWNRLQGEAGAGLVAKRSELAEVWQRIEGLLRAIEEGLYEPSMKARMQALEAEGWRRLLNRSRDCILGWRRSIARRRRPCTRPWRPRRAGGAGGDPGPGSAIVLVAEVGRRAVEVRG